MMMGMMAMATMEEVLTWSMTGCGRLSASMSSMKQSAPDSSRLSRRQARTFLIRMDLRVEVRRWEEVEV